MTQTEQVEVTQADVALERLLWRLSVTWASADEMQRAIARHRQSSIAPLVEEVEKAKADCQALCNALMEAVAMIGHCMNMSATALIGGKVLKAEDVWQSGFDLLFPAAPLPAKEGE